MENSLHEICVEAVRKMILEGITHHVSFISAEDDISFGLKAGGKIPKVTIEWADASEAEFLEDALAAQHGVQPTADHSSVKYSIDPENVAGRGG